MTAAISVLLLLTQTPAEPNPGIQFSQGKFTIQVGEKSFQTPLVEPAEKPKASVIFRKGEKYVVWDPKRGLTVREGKHTRSTRLPDASVSPKLFSREQIEETLSLIKQGKRRKEASALSGARRIGDLVYLLVRWDDRAKRPWLEALYKVDFSEERPLPTLVGRFDGLSLARAQMDEKLLIVDGLLSVVTRMKDGWGVSKFDSETNVFTAFRFGSTLRGYEPLSSRVGFFSEDSGYGTFVCGRVDLGNGNRRVLFETRGAVRLVGTESPLVALIRRGGSARLRNADSGEETTIPLASDVRRTPLGVLVWSPATKPTYAVLVDPEKLGIVARLVTEPPGALP
jgi:hypothetical protein